MDFQSSFVIIAWIGSFIVLVVVLVALFYKPPRKLKVAASFKQGVVDIKAGQIEFTIQNTGKKDAQIFTAFLKCISNHESLKYDLRDKVSGCHLPVSLKIGEIAEFNVSWKKLKPLFEQKSFEPKQIKIIVENSVGMEYESKLIDIPA